MTGSGIKSGNKVDDAAQQQSDSSIYNEDSEVDEDAENLQDFDSWLGTDPMKDVPIILREEYKDKSLDKKIDDKADRNRGIRGGIANRRNQRLERGVPKEEYGLFRGRGGGPSKKDSNMSRDLLEDKDGDAWEVDNLGPLNFADSWDQNIEADNLNTIILTDPALLVSPNEEVLFGSNPEALRRMRANCCHIFIHRKYASCSGQLGGFKQVQVCLKCFEIHCPASSKFDLEFAPAEVPLVPAPGEIPIESSSLGRSGRLEPSEAKDTANANKGHSFYQEQLNVQSRNKNLLEREQSNQQYSNADRKRPEGLHSRVVPDRRSEQRTGSYSNQSILNRPIGSHCVHTQNPNRETVDERDLDDDETHGIFRNMLGNRKQRKYEPSTRPARNDRTNAATSSRDTQNQGLGLQTYDLTSHLEPSNFIRQVNEASSTRFQEARSIPNDEGKNSFRRNKPVQPSNERNQRGAPRGMSRGRPRQRTRGRPLRHPECDSSSPSSMMSSSPEKNYVSNTSPPIRSIDYERKYLRQDEFHNEGHDRDDGLLSKAHFDLLACPGFSDPTRQTNNGSNNNILPQQSLYQGRGRAAANVRTRTAPSSKPSNKITEVRDEGHVMGYSIRLEDNSVAKLTSPLKGVNDFKFGPPTATAKKLENELKTRLRIGSERASSNEQSPGTSGSVDPSTLGIKKSDDIVVSYKRRMNGLWNLPEKSILDNDFVDHTTAVSIPQVSNDDKIHE